MSRELRPAPVARCLFVWSAAAAALGALGAWLLPDLLEARAALASAGPAFLAGLAFDEVLVWLCELALLASAGWLWLVTGLVALDAARGRVRGRRGVPAAVRRVVLAACGAALVGGTLAAPASAMAFGSGGGGGGGGGDRAVAGLPMPDRATVTVHVSRLIASVSVAEPPAPPPSPPPTVVVRPGDTLWSLAAQTLAPGAPDAVIAEQWQRIYRANRAVIGPDPDLIQPDQRLRLPGR
jgi:LysM repeat protein